MDDNKYYIYTHGRIDGSVYYVGKGCGRRAYSFRDRSWLWKDEFNKENGSIVIRIVSRHKSESDAFNAEIELIKLYKNSGVSLVNMSEGGAGPNGYKQSVKTRETRSKKLMGYEHKKITCNVCGFVGGETSTRRWHFENCRGYIPKYKSGASIFGERIHLGYFGTKDYAKQLAKEFEELVLSELSVLNRPKYKFMDIK